VYSIAMKGMAQAMPPAATAARQQRCRKSPRGAKAENARLMSIMNARCDAQVASHWSPESSPAAAQEQAAYSSCHVTEGTVPKKWKVNRSNRTLKETQ